ncbi:MAG TPA: hypothetical protein PLC89_25200 [Haliscomenobacter sp.]|uniref:hypothetical protein n=1 Tax=Haliscomenobacter sp. TaxID=2717303 RepID=UPI002C522385|nr:hypothetical protein [Haliscomenobacter sp.]HOY20633.1 hypothetical protein [Haliscomenobacter sp.]
MPQDSFEARLASFNIFMDELCRDYDEPISKSTDEVKKLIERLEENFELNDDFFIVASTLSIEFPYQVKALKYLGNIFPFNADTYIGQVHQDHVHDYLDWAHAIYTYLANKSKAGELKPMKTTVRMSFPIKMRDQKYYWTRMEVFPLQLDKNGNMITHLNSYKTLEPYQGPKPLIGEIWEEHIYSPAWTKELGRMRIMHVSFTLTSEERRILDFQFTNPDLRIEDVAQILNKKKPTIEKHNKNILAKAKECFPKLFEGKEKKVSVRELAIYLNQYGYFDGPQQEPQLSSW